MFDSHLRLTCMMGPLDLGYGKCGRCLGTFPEVSNRRPGGSNKTSSYDFYMRFDIATIPDDY
jgi:hypothetical protein